MFIEIFQISPNLIQVFHGGFFYCGYRRDVFRLENIDWRIIFIVE